MGTMPRMTEARKIPMHRDPRIARPDLQRLWSADPPRFRDRSSDLAIRQNVLPLPAMAIFTGLVIAIVFLLVGAAAFRYLVKG